MTNLVSDLAARPLKGLGFTPSRAAIINASGAIDGAVGNAADCVRQDGTTADKANTSHTHAQSDVTNLTADLTAEAAKAGDTFTGTVRIAGDQAYLECGPFQTVGGAFENMAKYSEDFSVATWDTQQLVFRQLERCYRARWKPDRRRGHRRDRHPGHPTADSGTRRRRHLHLLHLGPRFLRNSQGLAGSCQQRLRGLPGRSHPGYADDLLAAV